jgi:hypothetical protein
MLKLKKLYSLINRNVKLTLTDAKFKEVYFYGKVKDIPDKYDLYGVIDIIEYSNYDYTIVIKK